MFVQFVQSLSLSKKVSPFKDIKHISHRCFKAVFHVCIQLFQVVVFFCCKLKRNKKTTSHTVQIDTMHSFIQYQTLQNTQY